MTEFANTWIYSPWSKRGRKCQIWPQPNFEKTLSKLSKYHKKVIAIERCVLLPPRLINGSRTLSVAITRVPWATQFEVELLLKKNKHKAELSE